MESLIESCGVKFLVEFRKVKKKSNCQLMTLILTQCYNRHFTSYGNLCFGAERYKEDKRHLQMSRHGRSSIAEFWWILIHLNRWNIASWCYTNTRTHKFSRGEGRMRCFKIIFIYCPTRRHPSQMEQHFVFLDHTVQLQGRFNCLFFRNVTRV